MCNQVSANMPIVLQSTEEAKKHLLQSSKEVAEKLGVLAKALPAKKANLGHSLSIVGKSLDDLHTHCLLYTSPSPRD